MRWNFSRLFLLFAFVIMVGLVGRAHAVIGSVDTPGYARWVMVSGSYAYVADDYTGLQVIDVSNPKNPEIAGSVDTPGNARKVFVSGSFAYVADYWDGFHIVNISNPATPVLVSSLSLPDAAEGVFVSGAYAYVADGSSGLKIINVSNASAPAVVGGVNTPGYSLDVKVFGSYAYLADGSGGLQVIDVSNPAAPRIAGRAATPGTARGLGVSWPYAYIAADSMGIQVVDVSDPQEPKIVGSLTPSGTCQSITVAYPLLFVAADVNGLRVVDVSNPAAPSLKGTELTSSFALGVFVAGGYAFMADYDYGLEVIDVRKYFSHIVGSIDTPGNAQDVKVSGSYAYVADDLGGLQVIDIATPAAPVIVGALSTTGNAKGVFVSGSYAYVAEETSGLLVIDIDNPLSPALVGSVQTPGSPKAVFVSGSCAYVADGSDSGLQVIDINDPEDPIIVGAVITPGTAENVQVVGSYALVADGSAGLQVIDLSLPQSPVIISSLYTAGVSYEVHVSGSLAYLADGGNGLAVIELTDLENPIQIGGLETDSSAKGVRVQGPYAFVAANSDGLDIFDISDAVEPFLIVAVNTPGAANKVDLSGPYAYVADGPKGLQIIGISNFPCDKPVPVAPSGVTYPLTDTDGNFLISWQPSTYAQTYALQRADNLSFQGAISVYDGASTAFQQAGLFAGTFYYRVRAANDCGASPWSIGPGIAVSSFPPRPESIYYAAGGCGSNLAISWASSTGATDYRLERAANPAFIEAYVVYTGPQTSYIEASLGHGTYYYRVRASNSKGVSAWRTGGPTTVVSSPATPAGITYPTGSCTGSLAVTWPAASGAVNYTLQRATSAAFTDATRVYLGSSNAFTDSGIPVGVYYYRVQANNSCGGSGWTSGPGANVNSVPAAPTPLSCPSNNCGNSFTIAWPAVPGASEYTLQRATNASFSGATSVYSGPLTSFEQPALGNGTYYYRVRAGNTCGNSNWTDGASVIVNSLPATPATITYPLNLCGSALTVSWAAASRAETYILERAADSSFTGATQVYSGPATSFADAGLLTGSYYYRVKAVNGCGSGNWLNGSALTVSNLPAPPQVIGYPGNTCSGNFTVTWTPATGATGYTLQRATSASFANATTVYTGSASSSDQTGLADGTYYFRVRAGNGCGDSGWTEGAAVIVSSLPATPATLTYPSTNCGTSFTVAWPAVSGAASYILERATNVNFTDAADVFSGSSTSFSQSVLPAATYYYRVRSSNGCGLSNWQQGTAIMVTSAPSSPTTISYPSTNCSGVFTVSWTAANGAATYTLQRATNPVFSDAVTVFSNSQTSFEEAGLAEGAYYYRVRTNNDCGISSWQEGSMVTVTGVLAPPAGISYPVSNCSGSFQVTWGAVDKATAYTLQRATTASFNDAQNVHSGAATSFDQTGLAVGTYYYRVLATSACGNSAWRTGPAMTVTTTPGSPANITYPQGNCGGNFTVTWPTVNGAAGYLLQRASNAAFGDAQQVYSGASASYSETNLTAGSYYYRVLASNACGVGGWMAGAAITVTAAPLAPGNISYSSVSCTGTLTVSWPSVSGASTYTLQRATSSNFADATTVYSGASNSFEQTDLASGTYYFQVRADNECGTSAWKAGPAIAVISFPPTPMSITYPTSLCGGNFVVSWAEARDAANYTLQRATAADFDAAVTVTAYNGPSSHYSETVPGYGTFYYRVRASNGCGVSAWKTGPALTATPSSGAPLSLTYPDASCSGEFTVSWGPVDGATNYKLQRSMEEAFDNSLTVYSGLATSYSENGLGLGTFYYRVQATNGCGTGEWKAGGAINIAPSPPPSLPAAITYPANNAGGSFTVAWSSVSGASIYTLQRATDSSFADAVEVYHGAAVSYPENGLANGAYYYRVRTESDCGKSGWRTGYAIVVSNNQPPLLSGPVKGPAIGRVGNLYKFIAQATDPDGDPVQYRFSWGDGKTSGWATSSSRTHSWSAPNAYCVRAQARDSLKALSGWSDCATITVTRPPVLTGPPSGPTSGKVKTSYRFTGEATDPDGDPVQYRFSWGDGKTSDWGTSPSRSHQWSVPKTYCVKVQARDDKGVGSSWSGCASIEVIN